MALTQVDQGLLGQYAQYTGFKNRIINGAMMIDQRNAGASFTCVDNAYGLDRYKYSLSQASKLTAQQSSVTPTGVGFSYLHTVGAAANVTVGPGDIFALSQVIEGFNTADLNFGTASATSVTLSFWVRSSVTGTFSIALLNGTANRSYVSTYTVSAANTWEQKAITIAGDTSGTWIGATNGAGLRVYFDLGAGSTYTASAGSWQAGTFTHATGSTNLVSTNSATFYITGVQLEKGSTATSFDYRPYGTELQLCQRYYQNAGTVFYGAAEGTTSIQITGMWTQPMRAAPAILVNSGTYCSIRYGAGDVNNGAPTLTAPTSTAFGYWTLVGGFTGLTNNVPVTSRNNVGGTSNQFLSANAEL